MPAFDNKALTDAWEAAKIDEDSEPMDVCPEENKAVTALWERQKLPPGYDAN
jgi:hypothetical protein